VTIYRRNSLTKRYHDNLQKYQIPEKFKYFLLKPWPLWYNVNVDLSSKILPIPVSTPMLHHLKFDLLGVCTVRYASSNDEHSVHCTI
jgi:hypothetical protein